MMLCRKHFEYLALRARARLTTALLLGILVAIPVLVAATPDTTLTLHAPSLYEWFHQHDRIPTVESRRVVLALSGGGARGFAQIGVLKALEEDGYYISGIAGTSIGAIIGGLYASGYSAKQLDSLTREIEWLDLLADSPPRTNLLLPKKDIQARSFLTLHFRDFKLTFPAGVTGGQKLQQLLTRFCHAADYHARSNFDSLPTPFRCVATDLISGKSVALDQGDLVQSIRGSSAFPVALSPVEMDSMLLVDGGLTAPVPAEVARTLSKDLLIAVNTASELEPVSSLDNVYGVANQSTTIMTQPEMGRELQRADVIISPDLAGFSNLDFSQVDTLIARGYSATRRVLDSLVRHAERGYVAATEQQDFRIDSLVLNGLSDSVFAHREITAFLQGNNPHPMTAATLLNRLDQILENGHVRGIECAFVSDSLTVGHVAVDPLPTVHDVQLTGNTLFPDSVLLPHFHGVAGRPGDAYAIASSLDEILEYYHKQAYSLADIQAVELNDDGVLRVTITEGRLAGLQVVGNESVKDWVVTRHFPLQKGRVFNYRRLINGMEELHASGLFNHINGRVAHTPDGPLAILEVIEKDYDILRFGLRHDLEYQTDGFIEIVNTNLLGLGNEIFAHVGYCPRRERYEVGYRADRIFRTYLTASFRAYREIHERRRYTANQQTGFFETARSGLLASFGQNLRAFGMVSGTYRTEDIKLTDQPPAIASRHKIRSLIFAARYDDLDRLPFTRLGRRVNLSVEWADELFGGDVLFLKMWGEVENWFSLGRRFTLSQRVVGGTADQALPDFERFSLGGRRSLLGLNNDEFLGDNIVLSNIGARYRFFTRSYLRVRLDVGGVWEDDAAISFPELLTVGIGGGLSFDTPLGPLDLLGGVTDEDYTQFYFNWGYEF